MKNLISPLLLLLFFSMTSTAQTTLYSEDFASIPDSGVVGPSPYTYDTIGMTWNIDVSATSLVAATDYFKVITLFSNELFEGRDLDGEAIWTSEEYDITGSGLVDLSVDLSEVGTMEATSDYIKVFYILNGNGTEVLFSVNGENKGDFGSLTATESAISGTSVQIVIRVDNNADSEKHRFDNISVTTSTGYNTPALGDVLITEYAKNATTTHSYLELYNTTGTAISLADCKLVSAGSNNGVYDFSTDISGYAYIPANGFLLLNYNAAQSNFETQWGVTLSSSVIYTRTGLTIFKNNNTFKLKQGGSVGVDDGVIIDSSTTFPAAIKRVYQLPIGYWTSNEDDYTNATPGSFDQYEDPTTFDLAYTDGAWHAATGYGFSAPSSSTGAGNAVVVRGDATFTSGSALAILAIWPDAGTSISTETITVSSGLYLANNASLAITSTGSVTCSGDISVEREGFSLGTDYNAWGSPYSSSLRIDSVFANQNQCDIYALEASTQGWKHDYLVGETITCGGFSYSVTASNVIASPESTPDGNFDPARGYFIVGNADNTYHFNVNGGALNNGTTTAKIYGSSAASVDGTNDWNLLSNPYPSSLSADDFLSDNSAVITNALYLYNPNTGMNTASSYDTYNSTDGFNVASCQGFFVDANTTTDGLIGTVTFTNSMRSNSNTDFRSVSSSNYAGIYLSASNTSHVSDKTRLYFSEDCKEGFDKKFDAYKLENTGFNFSSTIDSSLLVFNGLPKVSHENRVIPLYFQTSENDNYTITMDSIFGGFSDKKVLLEDRFNRTFHELEVSPYTFSSAPKVWSNRFFLHIITDKTDQDPGSNDISTGIEDINTTSVHVFTSENELIVSSSNAAIKITEVHVHSITGQLASHVNHSDSVHRINTSQLSAGIYMVQYQLENGETATKKVVIQ